jgi:hypothetical protein
VDANQIELARKQIGQIEAEIANISEMELAPPEYYAKFLELVLQALQAPAGAVWIRTPQGNLVLQCQASIREVGIDRTPEDRAMHDELLRQAALQAKPAIVGPATSKVLDGTGSVAGNPTSYMVLLAPVLYEKEVFGLIEIWQHPHYPADAQRGYLNFLLKMAGFASAFTRNHRLRQMTGQQQLWVQLEAFARQVHTSLNPTEVAYWVANEGRRLVDADRVSVGVRTGRKVKVLAVSGADVVEKRSNLVQRMRNLMQSVVEWGEKLVYTGTKDDSLPPPVLDALDHYLAESNSQVLVVLPLRDERDKDTKRKSRTAILMESFEPKVGPQLLVERLEVVSKHAGPALYNAVEHRRIPMRFLWMPLAYLQDGMGGKAQAITGLVIACVFALVLSLIFIPYPLKMSANGELVPVDKRWVFAPWPGEVKVVKQTLNSGTPVVKGEELMVVEDTKLAEMIRNLEVEIQSADATTRRSTKNPDGSEDKKSSDDKAKAEIVKRARAQELQKLREMYNADVLRPGIFSIRAPITGVILNTDFRENLVGRKVQPHEQLIRIGATNLKKPKLAEWEVELKIPQKHVGQVLEALGRKGPQGELDVDILLTIKPTDVFKGKLRRDKMSWTANPNKDAHDEPEPVVKAWVRISGNDIDEADRVPTDLLLTGTEVHSRIRCGNYAMGYSVFYGVWEFTFEKVLFYLWP